MDIGVIADIHANRVALDAVLADCPPVDALVCAGDVVGYNPWPGECVALLRERSVPTVMGNHDRMVARGRNFGGNEMARAGVALADKRLGDEDRAWLEGLPAQRRLFDGRLQLVHGHPADPDRYTYPAMFSPAMLDESEVLVMGHTHVQAHERYDEGIVLNPGSVGQPRDGDPRAAYAIVDLEAPSVEERRVAYDIEAVIEAVDHEGLPRRTGTRLRKGR